MVTCKTILILLFFITPEFAFAQSGDSISSKLIGKWLLVKESEIGKEPHNITSNITNTYQFFSNGTYENIDADTKYGNGKVIIKGKWKISNDEKKIILYENYDEPDDPKTIIGDIDWPIIKLTRTELVVQDLFYYEERMGTIYYKKL